VTDAIRRATMTGADFLARERGEGQILHVADHTDRAKPPSKAPPSQPTSAAAIEVKATSWMWHPYLPANQITLLGGRGGAGKGLISASLVASLTNPQPWPDSTPAEPGNVLWCETEDPLREVVVPRLIAAGADRDRVWFADRACFAGLDLRGHIIKNAIKLIVLSPCVSFLKLTDINSELDVREVLGQLQAAIEGTGCAVLGICHTNKKADLAAIERLLGSVAFTNFVRCVLLVAPESVEDRTFRLVHAKHNLSPKGDDLLFTPKHVGEDPRDQFVKLEWSRPEANVDAEALFDRKSKANGTAPQSAGQWLVAYLQEHGECLRADVMLAAQKAGFSESAVRQAQQRNVRVQSRQDGWHGPYLWRLA
jgi:putative DNA primase/helicase